MIPELPQDCWIMKAFDYVRERTMLPEWVTFWMLIAYCGASLEDKIYVDWSVKPIFPNFPLLIVMPSGRGKTGAMNTIKPLFKNCIKNHVPEDSTAEAAMKEFASFRGQYGNAVGLWEVPEMADVFGRKDYQQGLIARVTRLLDAPKDKTVSRSTGNVRFQIQGHAVMNWIAGTTFEWLSRHVEDAVSSGGFLPRLITLYTDEPPKWVPNPVRDPAQETGLNKELYAITSEIGGRQQARIELGEDWLTASRGVYDDLVAAETGSNAPFVARRQENILRIYLILKCFESSFDILRQAVECSKFLETQAVNLAEDLIVRQNPLLQRVLGTVERHPGGISFSRIVRNIRGSTAAQVSACLEDLVKQDLVVWEPRGYGEKGILRPKVQE